MKRKSYKITSSMIFILLTAVMTGCNSSQTATNSQTAVQKEKEQPNILWIITDDQRPDSVSAYNRVMYGTNESPLGYVESPNIDKLAAEGTLFVNAFTNSPVCGPSRGSMLTGRYPFRNGHYAFELTHQNPDFVKPTVSQTIRDNGYQTSVFGKEDSYIFKWGPGQGFHDAGLFDYKVHFKHHLQANNKGDIFGEASYGEVDGSPVMNGYAENVVYADGRTRKYFLKRKGGELTEQDLAEREVTNQEFDILRAYTRTNTSLILAGENPQPADKTVDAYIVKEFVNYLDNANKAFKTSWGSDAKGANSNKPQYMQLGFHLPHTPVLPPKSIRDRFKTKSYNIPDYSAAETDKLPEQLQAIQQAGDISGMTYEEKQKVIQDYYAFCAHGDDLIGKAVEAFKEYSKNSGREYVIIYTIGDHGWHLGEQGIEAKFGPWAQSTANAAILVSSDKSLIPAGKVYKDLVEFVDFAPTVLSAAGVDTSTEQFDYLDGYNLFDVYSGKLPKRDYVLGEISVISGPRAYLHSERFRFSMRTRPFNNWATEEQLGKELDWALTTKAEKAEMTLYDLDNDPLEQNNLAYQNDYVQLAGWFRNKLGNIVLGDGRVEADWRKANAYHISNFAKGADDKVLNIPQELIPSIAGRK
ncbi:sulfatase-like hydrolase/transferase [Psychrosphaera algicola]|uniref:Sulfatase-like hydrolase/transferase n=1 Tax=Psychrosphaera algicola TaxID=3023714 RepID=A0ABT5FAH5_9GAMM|nr:sulfatase-like hydrolase/transferase [Psychrosphaera sp. G1-22]MDC2887570.1 sulfatase-like hydrolase/transferase [Psychrosphaera sp. G1-22]